MEQHLITESALTWWQAETSCKQQNASLLTVTDPHQKAYITGEVMKSQTNAFIIKCLAPMYLVRHVSWKCCLNSSNSCLNCSLSLLQQISALPPQWGFSNVLPPADKSRKNNLPKIMGLVIFWQKWFRHHPLAKRGAMFNAISVQLFGNK